LGLQLDQRLLEYFVGRLDEVVRRAVAAELEKVLTSRLAQQPPPSDRPAAKGHDDGAGGAVKPVSEQLGGGGCAAADGSKTTSTSKPPSSPSPESQQQGGEDGLIDVRALARLLGIGVRTAFRMTSSGQLPRPIRISGKITRWRLDEVRSWMDGGCPPQHRWEQVRDRRFQDWPPARKSVRGG
jgi:predicted DNA-binding transcriptional regulator AlpA